MRRKCQLFQDRQREASCHVYDDVRNGINDRCRSVREHCEDLWRDYWKFADEHFPVEFALQFHQRWFEMYLTVSLLRRGISIECVKRRPDILAMFDERRVWIEAVCAGKGEPGMADSVPDTPVGVVRDVPIREYVMRVRSSLTEKSEKYKKYANESVVGPEDLTAIAVNVGGIPGLCGNMDECVKRSVYGVGNQIVSLDRVSRKIVGSSHESKSSVLKSSGAPVGVQCFTDGSMAHVSAVLGTGTNAFNLPEQLRPGLCSLSEFVRFVSLARKPPSFGKGVDIRGNRLGMARRANLEAVRALISEMVKVMQRSDFRMQ